MAEQEVETEGAESGADVEDPQRRNLLTKATRLAVYSAPTLTALSFATSLNAAIPSPPDPPSSAEDMRRKPPNRR